MNQIKNSILFKNIKMEIENLMEKVPMLQIEYKNFGQQLSGNFIYLKWEMYQSGVYLEFKSWAEDLQSRVQYLLRLVSKRIIGALVFIIFSIRYKETERDRLNKLDYRPTSKIAQIEIEIEELDELINTKLDPAEEY